MTICENLADPIYVLVMVKGCGIYWLQVTDYSTYARPITTTENIY